MFGDAISIPLIPVTNSPFEFKIYGTTLPSASVVVATAKPSGNGICEVFAGIVYLNSPFSISSSFAKV